MLAGSVAEEIVRRAHCPVLTLKVPDRPLTESANDLNWESLSRFDGPQAVRSPEVIGGLDDVASSPTFGLISRAIHSRATDIHIDPAGQDITIRFRIDGSMRPYCKLSREVGRALITQIKVLANMDIADPFHSQESRLSLSDLFEGHEFRLTVVPVLNGDSASIRILSRNRLMRPMEELGISAESRSGIEKVLQRGEGLILVTGPTGSGKTTTLYSMLHAIDDGSRNIVSIEDPIEFEIPSFRQLAVDASHGTTMTTGLRTILRLDPDVVFVGEIRDAEAAETAMRAASSGKYVFSSLHTRDVASTVTALRDLHIDNRSLAGNLAGIISQRLIRRLCPECSRAAPTTAAEAALFHNSGLVAPAELRHPVGCQHCGETGYFDRIGIFEVVLQQDSIVRAINDGESEETVRDTIRACGISTLGSEALKQVSLGITSLEECQALSTISFT